MTREAIRAALSDPVALTCTLYGEAAGEPIEGQVAVGCVIRNRVRADLGADGRDDWWGEGITAVCLARWQFSCWWETSPNSTRVYALAEAMLARQPIGETSLIAELRWIAEGLIGGAIRDHVKGADHYLTTTLYRTAPPPWARRAAPVAVVGRHTFFRLG